MQQENSNAGMNIINLYSFTAAGFKTVFAHNFKIKEICAYNVCSWQRQTEGQLINLVGFMQVQWLNCKYLLNMETTDFWLNDQWFKLIKIQK